jgi:hypothetical protein
LTWINLCTKKNQKKLVMPANAGIQSGWLLIFSGTWFQAFLKLAKKPVLNALKLDTSVRWHDKLFLFCLTQRDRPTKTHLYL